MNAATQVYYILWILINELFLSKNKQGDSNACPCIQREGRYLVQEINRKIFSI